MFGCWEKTGFLGKNMGVWLLGKSGFLGKIWVFGCWEKLGFWETMGKILERKKTSVFSFDNSGKEKKNTNSDSSNLL